jgi:hypothetical protein
LYKRALPLAAISGSAGCPEWRDGQTPWRPRQMVPHESRRRGHTHAGGARKSRSIDPSSRHCPVFPTCTGLDPTLADWPRSPVCSPAIRSAHADISAAWPRKRPSMALAAGVHGAVFVRLLCTQKPPRKC